MWLMIRLVIYYKNLYKRTSQKLAQMFQGTGYEYNTVDI